MGLATLQRRSGVCVWKRLRVIARLPAHSPLSASLLAALSAVGPGGGLPAQRSRRADCCIQREAGGAQADW